MQRFKTITYIALLVAVTQLSACAQAIFAGATAAGVAIAQERTVGDAVDDNLIWSKIKAGMLAEENQDLFTGIGVRVNENRVLLTGAVSTPDIRAKAVQIAWSIKEVQEVINEIQLETQDGSSYQIYDFGMDTLISTQIKAKLLANRDIRSINYTVDTVNQIVYIMGVAQNEDEIQKVNYLAGTVKNVKKVINHVRIKNSKYRD